MGKPGLNVIMGNNPGVHVMNPVDAHMCRGALATTYPGFHPGLLIFNPFGVGRGWWRRGAINPGSESGVRGEPVAMQATPQGFNVNSPGSQSGVQDHRRFRQPRRG